MSTAAPEAPLEFFSSEFLDGDDERADVKSALTRKCRGGWGETPPQATPRPTPPRSISANQAMRCWCVARS